MIEWNVFRSLKLKESASVIASLVLIALASFFVVLYRGIGLPDFGDASDDLRSASSILSGEGYLREGLDYPLFRPPGYPFAIASIWKLLSVNSIIALKLFNISLHLFSSFIIFKVLRRNHNLQPSLAGIAIFGLNPFLLHTLSGVRTEPLILFLFLAFSYLLTETFSFLKLTLICLLALSITSVRPEYFFAILVICIVLMAKQFRSRESIINIVGIILILSLSLTWWGIQNKKATDSFIILTNATDYQLWLGSTEQIYENYAISLKFDPDFSSKQFNAVQSEIASNISKWGDEYSGASIGARSKFWRNEYIENVKASPVKYFSKLFEKMFIFWRPFVNPSAYGVKASAISMLILLPITAGTIIRLIMLRRKALKDIFILSYLSGLGVLTAVHMLQIPDHRYKFPLLIPLSSIVLAPLIWDLFIFVFNKIGISAEARNSKSD